MTGPMAKENPFRFSTKYQDDETDLLYYGYRYYNSSTGRWLSRDPIGEEGGVALYGFSHNNPVSVVDFFGLSFKIIPQTAPAGTIAPGKPGMLGRTWATKFDLLQFDAKAETVTCAYCVTLHVEKDYDVEVTSITPSSTPAGYTASGFNLIAGHEDRRAQVYSRAYEAYLAPVKDIIDGKYLCCSEPVSPLYLKNWALNLTKAYEKAFLDYVKSQNALISKEMDSSNLVYVNSLIDGSRYIYASGEMPGVGGLPLEPNCADARQ